MSTLGSSLNRDPNEVLVEIATSTLEDWGMMLTECSTLESFNPEMLDEVFFTSINLNGPNSGSINIIASKDFAKTLYQNLSGDFELEIADEDAMDCLKEMANVTAGRIITELFGEETVCDLTNLTCSACLSENLDSFKTDETTVFILGDDFPVGFSLKL
jgi:CheY-specific phosphatase CheX